MTNDLDYVPELFTLEMSKTVSSNGTFHVYVVGDNGVKVGPVWGPVARRQARAALLSAAGDLYLALEAVLEANHWGETKELRDAHDKGVTALRMARGEA